MSTEPAEQRLKSAGRNDPCPCGSGKKYKKCHRAEDEAALHAELSKKRAQAEADAAAAAAESELVAESKPSTAGAPAGKGAPVGARGKRAAAGRGHGGASGRPQGSHAAKLPRRGAV